MAALCALADEILQDTRKYGEAPTINGAVPRSEDVIQDAVMGPNRRLSSGTWAALGRLFSDLSRYATFMEGSVEGQAGMMPDAFADVIRAGEDDARYKAHVTVTRDGQPWAGYAEKD